MFQLLAGAGRTSPAPESRMDVPSPVDRLNEEDLLLAREEGAARVVDRLVEVLAGSSFLQQEKPPSAPSTNSAEDVRIKEIEKKELPQEEQDTPVAVNVLEDEAEETDEELGDDELDLEFLDEI